MNTAVERELEMKLVLSPERAISVPACLTYRADDPYAVHIAFHAETPHPVHWTFARELLIEGVFRASGEGDVKIWPTMSGTRAVICMALSSPGGEALLQAPASAVSAWLERTLRVVPPGSEHSALKLEEALDSLLATAPADEERPRGHRRRDGSGETAG